MKLVTGNVLWTSNNKIPNKYTYLSEDISCDVAIIGGGLTGAICSYYLSKEGVDTVVLEKNIIGYGSTRASTSILQYEIDTDLIGLRTMIGEENALRSFRLCEKAVYDIEGIVQEIDVDCEFRLRDCLYYSENPGEYEKIKTEYELRDKYGFKVEFIDKDKGKEKFSFPIEAGIYSTRGAAEINPYKFAHGLINKSIERGARVFENTEVLNIENHGDKVTLVTKNNFKIRANKVIIAMGYDSLNYFNEDIATIYRTFIITTTPLKETEGWHNQCIIRDTNNPYYYVRPTLDNRMILGGEDIQINKRESKTANLKDPDPISSEKYNLLKERLKYLFPNIKNIDIEFKFNGLFAVTNDGLPYIGEYEKMPNCYFNLGYGANGILYTLLGGQLLKDLYLGNPSKDLELFRFDRPTAKG